MTSVARNPRLLSAIVKNDIQQIKQWLSGTQKHQQQHDLIAILHYAFARRRPAIVHLLLNKGVCINRAYKARTILYESVCLGWVDVTEHLIELGVDVNVRSPSGWLPLEASLLMHDEACTETLMLAGAETRSNLAANSETFQRVRKWMSSEFS